MSQGAIENKLAELTKIDYSEDPENFYRLSAEIIEDFIASLPKERQIKARAIQVRLNRELSRYPSPEGRWQAMQDVFIKEVFEKEGGFVDTMMKVGGHKPGSIFPEEKKEKCEIIPFNKKKS